MNRFLLHIGPAANYYYFRNNILKRHNKKESDSYIYILPVNRAVRRFKKDLVLECNGALIDPFVFTFDEILRLCHRKLNSQVKIITQVQRRILLTEFLRDNAASFIYLKNERITDEGFIRHVEHMLLNLARFGYTAKKLGELKGDTSGKIHDFTYLLSGMEEQLGSFLSDEFLYTAPLLEQLDRDAFFKIFPGVKYLYLNGYGLYTPPMIQFLRKVKNWIDVEIKIDYLPENKELFAHTRPAYDQLSVLADKIVKHGSQEDPLSSTLFHKDYHYSENNKVKGITFHQTREDEIHGIAAEAKRLHMTEGVPWHAIGITFPDLESYSPLLREIFKSRGIPFNLSTGFPLAQSPLIQSIIGILQTVSNNYHHNDFIEIINSPFISLDSRLNVMALKRAVRNGPIRQFDGSWYRPKDNLRLSRETVSEVNRVVKVLRPLEQPLSAAVFYNTFYQVLIEIGLLSWYKKANRYLDGNEIEKEYRSFNKFTQLFEQMIWFLNRFYPQKKIKAGIYLSYLKSVIRDTQYHVREWSNYGVQIMPRLEIQSMECHILFVGGMIEGKFPRTGSGAMFFNEQERALLGLYSPEDILNQDRYQFYQLLDSPAKIIYLTMPLYEKEHPTIASSFLSALNPDNKTIRVKTILSTNEMSDRQLRTYFGHRLRTKPSSELLTQLEAWGQAQNTRELKHWFAALNIYVTKKKYDRISKFEGDLSSSHPVKSNLSAALHNHIYSVSALEQYAFCPMQYFLNRLLKLQPDEIVEEGITALLRGRLLHRILHYFYSQLKSDGNLEEPWRHKELLRKITNTVLNEINQRGISVILEEEKLLGSELEPGLWDTFLQHEQQEITRTGFVPFLFEWDFGKEKSFTLKGTNGAINLTGIVDRIDTDSRGNYIVYDYKTGWTAQNIKIRQIIEGSSLQLPVYLAVVRECIRKIGRPAGAAWFQIKDSKNCGRVYVVADDNGFPEIMSGGDGKLPSKKYNELTLSDLVENSLKNVVSLVEKILAGQFRHTMLPKDKRCSSYCTFKLICRKDVDKLLQFSEKE